MIKKVISGGQIGADAAGVITAAKFGIPTGGCMPKGYKTIDGTNPKFAKLYGLRESLSPSYAVRTEANVMEADGTIRFAISFKSPGEKCTLKAIKKHDKLYIDVDILNPISHEEVVDWIHEHNIEVLNVAGNGNRNIEQFVIDYLSIVFDLLQQEKIR